MSLAAVVEEFFQRHGLQNSPGIVALSGGPDSVALAHLLAGLYREGKFPHLILAHVNHLLRGAESDADETFVRSLADSWQLSCRITRIDVAMLAKAEKENLEALARRERYRWLQRLALTENAVWVATGHTADDQAETVLFRLLRGSGVRGLSGIPDLRPLGAVVLVRPLLMQRRQTLRDALHDQHIPFRQDSSNDDRRRTRNRLRHELLPLLQEEYNPAIVEVLCRTATQAHALYEEVAAEAAQLLTKVELPRAGDQLIFAVIPLQGAAPNLVREAFRLVWQREGWPLGNMDFSRWQRLVEIVTGSCRATDFPGKIHARRVGQVLQIHSLAQ